METVIRAEKLSKMYHIGKKHSSSLRETITGQFNNFFSKKENDVTEFWALKDVSFEVQQGEVIGIIGKNGAGKSTLLKILSRITEPTSGRVEITGRVSSLLEVGTGFHPELTGRENIFMNGAILGMKRAEIKSKFDEIVAFSGIEQFIDTPVKRYSSGMYVRLAFAVAAHLEPEILIIDEVLAVGDAEFQKKCLGKMKDVSEHDGRTIIFVSHNLLALKSLCDKAILLNRGKLVRYDEVNAVANLYQDNIVAQRKVAFKELEGIQSSNDLIELVSIELITDSNEDGIFNIDKPVEVKIELINKSVRTPINVNIFFNSPDGILIFATCSTPQVFSARRFEVICNIPANFWNDNVYALDVMVVSESRPILYVKDILHIEGVEPPRELGWLGKFPGLIRPTFTWEIKSEN